MKSVQSDKFFWHGYPPFYEQFFHDFNPRSICEIGIDKGCSVRWLLERFPFATVLGADIKRGDDSWPTNDRFSTKFLDQEDVDGLRNFFVSNSFDLIIEDGSHHPKHQADCLRYGFNALRPGGLYILEDIHTSHPRSNYYHPRAFWKKIFRIGVVRPQGNSLSVLLAINHYKRIGVDINQRLAALIASGSIFSPADVYSLAQQIEVLELYRRSHLPDRCHCGETDYNFSNFQCSCGKKIFSDDDSMSFVIKKVSRSVLS